MALKVSVFMVRRSVAVAEDVSYILNIGNLFV